MSNVTCPRCNNTIKRVTDREYLFSCGWELVPWTPDHRRNATPFRDPNYPHGQFTLSFAIIRQEFYNHRGMLQVVSCLWDGIVRDIYVSGEAHGHRLIGNPDGHDDWGHLLIPCKGISNGKKYDYIQGDML